MMGQFWEVVHAIVGRLLFPLHFVLDTVGRCLVMWFFSRPLPLLFWGLPAVVVATGLGIVTGLVRSETDTALVAHYQQAAIDAQQRGEEDAAALWMKKTVMLEPDAPQHQFQLALTAAQQGRRDQAREVMRRIAPRDEQGYSAAHFWLARDMVASELMLTPEVARTLEHHLTAATRNKQVAGEAHVLLGNLYLRQQKLDQAIPHFETVAKTRPEFALTLGELYLHQWELRPAKSRLEKAARHFRELVQEDPTSVEAQLAWARCETLLGHAGEAEQILKRARDGDNDPRYASALADLYVLTFDGLRREQPDNLEQALILLEEAAALAPNDPRVVERLAQLTRTGSAARDEARRLLRSIVASGRPTAAAHLLLGAIAAEDGEVDAAETHFELGLELRPETLGLMNNLAWVLAHAESPDLERALQLIDIVHEKAPDNPEVLETRGQILAKLGQWRQCIVDLEKARPSMPERGRVHETLALAYENIGDQELADVHRQLAEKLRVPQGRSQ
jgi:tetratricopeptide (TPR) repeat protein